MSAPSDDLPTILAELQPQEPIFHRPACATSLDDFALLMAPDYWEIGASGRRYNRAFILEHLAHNTPKDAAAAGWITSDFALRRLGPDTFLLTYALDQAGRLTRRATLWQCTHKGWQILYHEGTIRTGEPDDTDPGPSGYTPRPDA